MLFIPPKNPIMTRLHGAFVTLSEIRDVVDFVKEQQGPEYDEKLVKVIEKGSLETEREDEEKDVLFEDAVDLILHTGQASASYLQRRMKVGYARAARLIDQMEAEGIVGPADGSKPREILVDNNNR
jgi:S-DNA-T family DNA segregation ATPase FtsK/SpoIIIE